MNRLIQNQIGKITSLMNRRAIHYDHSKTAKDLSKFKYVIAVDGSFDGDTGGTGAFIYNTSAMAVKDFGMYPKAKFVVMRGEKTEIEALALLHGIELAKEKLGAEIKSARILFLTDSTTIIQRLLHSDRQFKKPLTSETNDCLEKIKVHLKDFSELTAIWYNGRVSVGPADALATGARLLESGSGHVLVSKWVKTYGQRMDKWVTLLRS